MNYWLYREATPVARKPHQCWICHATIAPGTRYYLTVVAEEDNPPTSWRECLDCTNDNLFGLFISSSYMDGADEYEPQEIREWAIEVARGESTPELTPENRPVFERYWRRAGLLDLL